MELLLIYRYKPVVRIMREKYLSKTESMEFCQSIKQSTFMIIIRFKKYVNYDRLDVNNIPSG